MSKLLSPVQPKSYLHGVVTKWWYKAPKHSLSCQRMEVVRTQDLENLIHAKDVKALVSSTTNVQALWKGISQSQTPSKSYTPYSTKALINSAAVAEWYKAPKHFLS